LCKKVNKNNCYALLSYDDRKRLIREDTYSAEGEIIRSKQFQYQGSNLAFEIDPIGNVSEYRYDGAGRKIAQIKHGGHQYHQEEYFYDALGRLFVVRKWFGDAPHAYTQNIKEFDLLNRVIEERVEDSSGEIFSRVKYQYDINGNCIEKISFQETDQVAVQKTDFTSFNLPKVSIDPLGYETHFAYDFNYKNDKGQKVLKTLVTDPMGIQVITIQDTHGRDESIQKRNSSNQLLSSERFVYDFRGLKLIHFVDVVSAGEKLREFHVRWSYDTLGRPTLIVEDQIGKNKCTAMTYTSLGNLETKTKPDGVKLFYQYDQLGREIGMHSSDGSVSYSYTYDLNDHLLQSADHINGFNLSRQYDFFGNLIFEEFPNGWFISLQYDGHQRLTDFLLPDSSCIKYEYDPVSMVAVKRISNQGEVLYTHFYDKKNLEGRSLKSTMITGDKIYLGWDALGRMVSMNTPYASEEIPSGGYDPVGNLLQVNVTGVWGRQSENYNYDDLNHLVHEENFKTHEYLNDSLHNRLSKDEHHYSLNTLNQIEHDGEITYHYDSNGNLISQNSEGRIDYQYDALNRLVSIIKERKWVVKYGYDSFGRCINRKKFYFDGTWIENENRHFIFQGLHEIGSIDPVGKIQELRVLGQREGLLFRVAIAVELGGEIYAPIYDHRFNVIALIDFKTKLPIESYRYSAYGEVAIYGEDGVQKSSSQVRNLWLFGSKRYDPLTDLYNFGKRYYRPALGRWITPDPENFVDGLNLYAYTHNRPMICTDFYGFQSKSVYPVYGGLARGFNEETFTNWGQSIESTSHHLLPISELQYCGEGFGRLLQGKSYTHECAGDLRPVSGKMGDGAMGNRRVRQLTGILTSVEMAESYAESISGILKGGEVHYTCHQTKGFASDVLFAGMEYLDFGKSSIKEAYRDIINDYHEMKHQFGDDFSLHYIPHSRGALEFYLLSQSLPKEIKNKINVYAIGPAKLIPKGDFNRAVNFANKNDAVVSLGKVASLIGGIRSPIRTLNELFFDKPEVVYTDYSSHSWTSPIDDHLLDSPGYQKALKDISNTILKERK
jgi:RHS repeat-associated protein